MTTALAVATFVIAYGLIASERVHRVAAALGGAAVMVFLGIVDTHVAFYSERTGVDWNVIFLLFGMMVIVSVLKQTGVFDYLAIAAAKKARGRPFRLMVMLMVITAFASALLDNVTTVLLIAPVTILVCERLGVPVAPYLIAEVMASNIGGAATLIGDPPNIIVGSRAGLSFNEFVVNLGPIVVVLIAVLILMCRFMFRAAFLYDETKVADVMALNEREVIRDGRLLVQSGVVLVAVIGGFIAHASLDVEPSLVALLGAGALVAISRLRPREYLEDVEWSTLVFFMGLFVMVGALVEVGVIESLAEKATEAVDGRWGLASTVLLWASAALSGIVDNIPYVASATPLVEDLATNAGEGQQSTGLWWSLALGADLGGNATAVGASANVVVLGIAARSGHALSFWQFTRYGLLVTVVTVAVSWPYILLRYYAGG